MQVLSNPTPNEYTVAMTVPGLYVFTIQVTDGQSNVHSDTATVLVMDAEALDSLLRSKWESMRSALAQRNIEDAVKRFSDSSKTSYRETFSIVISDLPDLSSRLGDIQFIKMLGSYAEYDLRLPISGHLYSFYLLFAKDGDGLWKIRGF